MSHDYGYDELGPDGQHGSDEFCSDCTGAGCWRLRAPAPSHTAYALADTLSVHGEQDVAVVLVDADGRRHPHAVQLDVEPGSGGFAGLVITAYLDNPGS